jgi:hypothetical protein
LVRSTAYSFSANSVQIPPEARDQELLIIAKQNSAKGPLKILEMRSIPTGLTLEGSKSSPQTSIVIRRDPSLTPRRAYVVRAVVSDGDLQDAISATVFAK